MDLGFGDLDSSRPGSVAHVKSSWRVYATWMAQEHGVAIPVPEGSPDARRPPTAVQAVPLPEVVKDAVRELVRVGLSLARVHSSIWEDIDFTAVKAGPDGDTVILRDPKKTADIRVPLSAICVLADYAQAGHDYTTPLVPFCPGSPLPYPLALLRRAAATKKESVVEQARKARERLRGSGEPGSAMGGSYTNYDPSVPVADAVQRLSETTHTDRPTTTTTTVTTTVTPPRTDARRSEVLALLEGKPAPRPSAPASQPVDLEMTPEQLLELVGQLHGMTAEEVKARLDR
jgi:hypothetical protein